MTLRPLRDGRPAVLSDAAIQFCLPINILSKPPLRQTSGMVARLLKLTGLNWPVPDFSTLCSKQKTLAVQAPYRRADGPLNLFVDSTEIKFLGAGEWQAQISIPLSARRASSDGSHKAPRLGLPPGTTSRGELANTPGLSQDVTVRVRLGSPSIIRSPFLMASR